jgi:hypothetical protein
VEEEEKRAVCCVWGGHRLGKQRRWATSYSLDVQEPAGFYGGAADEVASGRASVRPAAEGPSQNLAN